jgi:hypothetical protein
MRLSDLPDYVEHFRYRVLQDALSEATAAYWRRRAETFEAALPRPGDYTGRATPEQIQEQRLRVAATILACRERSVFMLGGEIE